MGDPISLERQFRVHRINRMEERGREIHRMIGRAKAKTETKPKTKADTNSFRHILFAVAVALVAERKRATIESESKK